MCGTCGCGQPDARGPQTVHAHAHAAPGAAELRRVEVERSLLAHNEHHARALREKLAARGIDSIGLCGGPGSGKTALLEATLRRLGADAGREAVVEGDCATDHDARRIAACGARVAQVATGSLCHLDAHLVEHALEEFEPLEARRLWIENVGNLVCPAPFPCGEQRRAVLVSVAEGDDKPEKYPALFTGADLLVITKLDLLPHVDFDVERCTRSARSVQPGLAVLAVSARTGAGLDAWLDWADRAAPAREAG